MSTYRLDILTPERKFFSGDVEALIYHIADGEICILKGHMPMVTALEIGAIRIKQGGKWREAAASEGFVEVRPDQTLIFAQAVEWPEEIDVRRAKAALEMAEEQLRQKKSMLEYRQSEISLARAMARLRVTNQNTKDYD
ncbi:MAG: ATP synthase F1 subunit epsilon [Bacillota bacterium]|nr:ATP synthase F1 subunit epsilon [Bacillota bacterium]